MGGKVSRAGGVCAICQEPDRGEMARPSSCPTHFFHRRCLLQWASRKSCCPLDNTPFLEVVGMDGSRSMIQRFRSYTEDGRSQAAQLMRLANPISRGIVCKLCRRADETLELVVVRDCKHVFHRRCVVRFARKFHRCPGEGCYNKSPVVGTEFEEEIAIPAKDAALCSVCGGGETGEEWARPDACQHSFHRACLRARAKQAALCPREDCGRPLKFLLCDYGDRIGVRPAPAAFRCCVCDREDGEREAAVLVPCCHLVHRDCLLFSPRLSLYCRQPGCCQRIESFITEAGVIVIPSEDDTASAYAKAMAGTNFLCFLCKQEDNERERAKPASCGCEFHRDCLTRAAKESVGRARCPNCRHEYSRIQCLFGDDIVLKEVAVPGPPRRQSYFGSAPDLARAARAQEVTSWERDAVTVTRAHSQDNLL